MINSLPPEIYIRILELAFTWALPPDKSDYDQKPSRLLSFEEDPSPHAKRSPAAYAAVCKWWQLNVERISFAWLHLTPEKVAKAAKRGILTKRRLAHVRRIELGVPMEAKDMSLGRWETRDESSGRKARNNALFCDAMVQLFQWLKPLDYDDDEPADSTTPGIHLTVFLNGHYEAGTPYLIDLGEATHQALTPLAMVRSFEFDNSNRGHWCYDLSSPGFARIASSLPRLHTATKHYNAQHEARQALADSIALLPTSVVNISTTFPFHERFPTDLVQSEPLSSDPLSLAWHRRSQDLVSLDISWDLAPEFFWPLNSRNNQNSSAASSDDDRTLPFWPRLKHLRLQMGCTCSADMVRYNDCCTLSVDPTLDWQPLDAYLRPMALAAARMPALVELKVTWTGSPDALWESRDEPGYGVTFTPAASKGGNKKATLIITSPEPYEMPDDAHRLWEEAAVVVGAAGGGDGGLDVQILVEKPSTANMYGDDEESEEEEGEESESDDGSDAQGSP